jgi:hypothetical protein
MSLEHSPARSRRLGQRTKQNSIPPSGLGVLTTPQLMQKLGVSKSTIWNWVRLGTSGSAAETIGDFATAPSLARR